MEILPFILHYIIIGIAVSFLTDIQRDFLVKRGLFDQDLYDKWGISERIIVITLWPMAVIIYIKGMLK